MKQIIAMVEEDSDDSSEYSDDEDELGNKVGLSYPKRYFAKVIRFYRLNILELNMNLF